MIQVNKLGVYIAFFFISFTLFAGQLQVIEKGDFCYAVVFANKKYIVKKYTLSNEKIELTDTYNLKLPTDHSTVETHSVVVGKVQANRFSVSGFFNQYVLLNDNYKKKGMLYNLQTNTYKYIENPVVGFGIKHIVQLDNKLLLLGVGTKSNPKLRRDDFYFFVLVDTNMENPICIGAFDIKLVFTPVNGKSNFPIAFYYNDKKKVGLYFPVSSWLWSYNINTNKLEQKSTIDNSNITSNIKKILCIKGKLIGISFKSDNSAEIYLLSNNKWIKSSQIYKNVKSAFVLKNHLVFLDTTDSFKVVRRF